MLDSHLALILITVWLVRISVIHFFLLLNRALGERHANVAPAAPPQLPDFLLPQGSRAPTTIAPNTLMRLSAPLLRVHSPSRCIVHYTETPEPEFEVATRPVFVVLRGMMPRFWEAVAEQLPNGRWTFLSFEVGLEPSPETASGLSHQKDGETGK